MDAPGRFWPIFAICTNAFNVSEVKSYKSSPCIKTSVATSSELAVTLFGVVRLTFQTRRRKLFYSIPVSCLLKLVSVCKYQFSIVIVKCSVHNFKRKDQKRILVVIKRTSLIPYQFVGRTSAAATRRCHQRHFKVLITGGTPSSSPIRTWPTSAKRHSRRVWLRVSERVKPILQPWPI